LNIFHVKKIVLLTIFILFVVGCNNGSGSNLSSTSANSNSEKGIDDIPHPNPNTINTEDFPPQPPKI